jgi:hypothetical protein
MDLIKLKDCADWLSLQGKQEWSAEIEVIITKITKDRISKNNSKKKQQKKDKLNGICREGGCSNPIEKPYIRCSHHLAIARQKGKKHRDKLFNEGYCTRCSTPLLDGMDNGYITCLNCRQVNLRIR